jgi:PAS domain S-box-containing protein
LNTIEKIAALATSEMAFCGISSDGVIEYCSNEWRRQWPDQKEGMSFFQFYGLFEGVNPNFLKDRFRAPSVWEENGSREGKQVKFTFKPQISSEGKQFFWCICEIKEKPKLVQRSVAEDVNENLFEGVFRTDMDANLIYSNMALVRMLGYNTTEEMRKVKAWDFFMLNEASDQLLEHFRMNDLVHDMELLLRRRDGSLFWSWVNLKRVPNGNGSFWIDGSVRDASSFKKMEMELREAKIRSEQASQVKQQFLGSISHELRTPLNAVIGFAHLLKNCGNNDERTQHINTLLFSADGLLKIINNIIDFSSADAGRLNLNFENFNLHEHLHHVASLFKLQADQKQLNFRLDIDAAVPVYVKGDVVRLTQILNNVLSNALKFTYHGEVTFRVIAMGNGEGKVRISFFVRDTGIGIPASKLEGVMGLFTQGNSTSTRAHSGTGLGLTLTKKLIELHGGELHIDSSPGYGTNVSFELLFLLADGQVMQGEETSAQMDMSGVRVLIAEDNEVNQLLLRKFLTSWGCRVSIAENGREAVEMLAAEPFDILLMDIQMPIMDGYTAAKQIRSEEKLNCDIPIIAVTATIMSDVIEQMEGSGMTDYLLKPYTPETLRELLEKHIKYPLAQQDL